jgi:pyocin large subunit-like protein
MMPPADKISTERKAGKISAEKRATLRHLVRERDDALSKYLETTAAVMQERVALREYEMASERLRAYRETLQDG